MGTLAFPLKTNIVLIPFWIAEQCRRSNTDVRECVNISKIKPMFSLDDLIGFAALQDSLQYCLGLKEKYSADLFDVWYSHLTTAETDLRNFLNDTLFPMAKSEEGRETLASRLFVEEAYDHRHTEAFTIHDLEANVVGVVLYPTYFNKGLFIDQQRKLISEILKVLYVYNTMEEVSKTPCFDRYLELLSETTVII